MASTAPLTSGKQAEGLLKASRPEESTVAIPKTLLATLISDLTAQQRIMRTCADRVRELQDAREWADLYACAWQSLAEHRIPPEARPLLIKLLHGDRHQGTAQEIRAVLNLNVDNRSSIG